MEGAGDFDVVRRWFDAFNRRDLAETLALAHADITFRPLQVHGSAAWHGLDGVEALWGRMAEVGLDHMVEIRDLHRLEDGDVAAVGVVKPGDVPFVGIYRLRDGLIVHAHNRFADENTLRRLGIGGSGGDA
jgi:ketosteroid isomerase-like protein